MPLLSPNPNSDCSTNLSRRCVLQGSYSILHLPNYVLVQIARHVPLPYGINAIHSKFRELKLSEYQSPMHSTHRMCKAYMVNVFNQKRNHMTASYAWSTDFNSKRHCYDKNAQEYIIFWRRACRFLCELKVKENQSRHTIDKRSNIKNTLHRNGATTLYRTYGSHFTSTEWS